MNVIKNTTRLTNQYNCFMHSGNWEDGSILPKHERESDIGYSRRKAGFCSPDLYSYLIKTYGVLFSKPPIREDYDDVYGLFIDDCGYGMNLNSFVQSALELSGVLGSVAIVMDADKEQPGSIEEMGIQRTWPYMEMILPQNIITLVVDKVGRIAQFGYQYYEATDVNQTLLYECLYKDGKRYKTHTETDSKGNKTELIDSVTELPFGRIPVIFVVPSQEPLVTAKLPSSPTLGLYHQQLNVAVTNSLIDESLYSQQFSVLTIATNKDASKLNLGAGNALVIAPGDTANFISPAGTPIEMMLKRVELSVNMMIRTFANMLTNGNVQSGEAKVIDRQVGALQLKNVANYLEQIEYKIYEVFQCFMGNDVAISGYDYTVEYYKDFDLTDIAGYIAQAIEVTNMNISDEAKMEVRKSVLRKFMSGEDKEKIESIIEVEGKNKEPMPVDGLDTVTKPEDDTEDNQTTEPSIATDSQMPVVPNTQIPNTALNGAQVTSLLDILAQVSSSVIPKESAKATIQFAFPGVDTALVDSMLNSIVPKAPVV